MEITEKSNCEPWNTGNSTCKKSLSHGKHADTGWWRVHQHPVQMIVRNALLWAPVPVRLLLEMDEIHTATAQIRVGKIDWAEGGRSADLHHMWEEKCHRRWTICETCVFLCVCEKHKERVCLSPASSRGFIASLVLIGISAFCQTSLEEPGKGVKHVHCLLQHYRTFELSG